MAKKVKPLSWITTVAIVAVYFWYYQSENGLDRASAEKGLSNVSLLVVTEDYELLENCSLKKNRRNDGDSFFVKHPKGETEFRLYYVDAPESKYKEYSNGETNGERINDQGKYFGGLDRERTTEVGDEAKRFVAELLGKQPFKVITRWENVFSPERRYAFVVVEYHGEKAFLHELLVEQGLARIHTKPSTMPDGFSTKKQLQRLRKLEKSAKKARLGGW